MYKITSGSAPREKLVDGCTKVQKYKSTKVQKYKSTWEAPRGKSLDGCTRVLEENVDDGKGVALLAIAW